MPKLTKTSIRNAWKRFANTKILWSLIFAFFAFGLSYMIMPAAFYLEVRNNPLVTPENIDAVVFGSTAIFALKFAGGVFLTTYAGQWFGAWLLKKWKMLPD